NESMKLLMFSVKHSFPQIERVGVIEESGILDLAACYRAYLRDEKKTDENRVIEFSNLYLPHDMTKFLEGGEISKEAAEQAIKYGLSSTTGNSAREKFIYEVDEVRIHTPIKHPPTTRDFLTFEEHYKNALGGEIPS